MDERRRRFATRSTRGDSVGLTVPARGARKPSRGVTTRDHPTTLIRSPERTSPLVTFPEVETTVPAPVNQTRAEAAAGRAGHRPGRRRPVGRCGRHEPQASSRWAPTPRPRTASPRRSGSRASWATAREHYQTALALDPTNRIAERNIDRLKVLLVAAGEKTVPAKAGSKAPGLDLRRGDRQDRLRLPDGPRPPRASWPRSTPATTSR